MPRLFIAIGMPPEFKWELAKLQDDIADRLQMLQPPPNFKPENLTNSHCTIRFLGNVMEAKIPELSREVTRAINVSTIPSFAFRLGTCGMFLHRHRARIIWVGLDPEGPFQRLQHSIDQGLAAAGIPFEAEHSFHPHVTLFRFRKPYSIPPDFEFPAPASISLPSVAAEALLIESKTLSDRPVHTVQARFSLR